MPKPPREQPSPDTAPRQFRVQTTGIRILQCECGATSRHQVRPQTFKLTCPTCHVRIVVGNLIMRVPSGGAVGRDPADLPIPDAPEETAPTNSAGPAEELNAPGGTLRSRDPINVVVPELKQLWKEISTDNLYNAASCAFGTRYAFKLVDVEEQPVQYTDARDWLSRFERLA